MCPRAKGTRVSAYLFKARGKVNVNMSLYLGLVRTKLQDPKVKGHTSPQSLSGNYSLNSAGV